jgi:hypothetical protein
MVLLIVVMAVGSLECSTGTLGSLFWWVKEPSAVTMYL